MSSAPSSLASSASRRGRGGLIAWAIILGVLLIAVVVVIALALRGLLPFGPGAASESETTLTLEPANSLGENPFASTSLAATVAASPTAPLPTRTGATTLAVSSGAAPGLYGGSGDPAVCNVDQLVSFLQADPTKGEAWVEALNTDPTLGWPGGALTVADIPAYVAGLTVLILNVDTRVTNHGFSDSSGTAYPLQSLLQKGTAVLIDKLGVPRVKCNCGNPLLPPETIVPPDDPADPPADPPGDPQPCLPPPIVLPDGEGGSSCETTTETEDPPTEQPESFEGEYWEDPDEEYGTTTASETPISEFQATNPDGSGALVPVPAGCAAQGTCTQTATYTNPNLQQADDGTTSTSPDPGTGTGVLEDDPVPPTTNTCSASTDEGYTGDATLTNGRDVNAYVWLVEVDCSVSFYATLNPGQTIDWGAGNGRILLFTLSGSDTVEDTYVTGSSPLNYTF